MSNIFDPGCRRCPRLAAFLDAVKSEHPSYYCKPVPPFGDPEARLLIVGLAPGKHGANRSGRPFTGDHAGILLYASLFKFGLANGAVSAAADDGLKLIGTRITNAVKAATARDQNLQWVSARRA
jgi:uracil-DNA glycosylase